MKRKPLQWAALVLSTMILSIALSSCGVKDSTIQEKITEAAKNTPELSNITSTVKDGVVTLTGEVKDDAAKAASEAAIKAIKGVKSVENNITVTPPPPPPPATPVVSAVDEALGKGVTDATKDFPSVKAAVKDGVITLTGEIKKSSLPKLMQTLNSLKPTKIDNQLTVK